jgi:hypothetical protein
MHSSASPEWGSPALVADLARYTFGGEIDLDPASNAYWNHHVIKARCFYDKEQDGLRQTWYGHVLLNPPGESTGQMVRSFWERLTMFHREHRVRGAVYVGFSLEQLGYLQSAPTHPLQWVTVIPCERMRFLKRDPRGGPPFPEKQPTHSNFLTLLPDLRSRSEMRAQVERFRDRVRSLDGGAWGAMIRPA